MHQRPAGARVSLFARAKAGIASIFKSKAARAEARIKSRPGIADGGHSFRRMGTTKSFSANRAHRRNLRSIQRMARRKERKIRVYGYSW